MPPHVRDHSRLLLGMALLAAVLASWPLWSEPGLLNTRGGGDSPFLLQRLYELETAVRGGHFPVRWMPHTNYGYGYPFYNFYAPLSIYIAAFFRLFGAGFVRAIQAAQVAGFVIAAWGAFALARRWFDSAWAGLLTAVAYTAAPFHLVNVYVRGDSLAEFWAMAFYPLTLLAADQLLTAPSGKAARPAALLALGYAGLTLSHNISAMIFSPFLLLAIGLRWLWLRENDAPSRPRAALLTAAALALGLALAAWFFVPALGERSLAQLGSVTEGYFSYETHFLGRSELPLVQDSFFFNYDVQGRAPFRMGLVQAILGVLALPLLWWARRRVGTAVPTFIALTILIATFMMLPASRPLWANLPLLAYTQFPWRFLSVQALGLALAIGSVGLLPWRAWLTPALALLLLGSSLGDLHPDHLPLTDADVTAQRLAEYEWFTGNIGSTVSAEYLPPTVSPRPYTSDWLHTGHVAWAKTANGRLLDARQTEVSVGQQTWEFPMPQTGAVTFSTLYWPGWTAVVNGVEAPIRPSPGAGLITLDLPAGENIVSLRLTRTPLRLGAELASLAALLLTVWLLRPRRQQTWRRIGLALGAAALLAVGGWLWPERPYATTPDTRTWDFSEMGYLHHAPDGIPFSNGDRLLGYTLSADAITAGDTLTVTLQWADAPPLTTVTLATPAINRPEFEPPAPPLAAASGQQTTLTLTVPADAPAGLVTPYVQVAAAQALTDSGRTRGALALKPVRIVPGAPPDTPPGSSAPDARAWDVQRLDAETLLVKMGWWTPQALERNLNVALRLTDANGRFLRLADRQPGFGLLPSSDWPVQQWVHDWQTIGLPPAAEGHAQPYVLVAQLYNSAAPTDVALTRRLGEISQEGETVTFTPHAPQFSLPADVEVTPETAVFGAQIKLLGYAVTQDADALQLTLAWEALTSGTADYVRFVHLLPADAPNAPPVVQDDAFPQHNSYPTSQWTVREMVVETVTLPLADAPPGAYQLALGFYDGADPAFTRLTAVDGEGKGMGDGRFLLPAQIVWEGK